MKIKNEQIMLKIGGKKYEFKNLILDEYLKRFAKRQIDKEQIKLSSNNTELLYCLLKFDTPIENLNSASKLRNQDFDVCIVGGCKYEQQISNTKVIVNYNYEYDGMMYDYKKSTAIDIKIKDYYGRKITAIGFNVFWGKYVEGATFEQDYVCSVLDTSNYDIYLQEKQEISITRKDIIETDAIFSSNDEVKIPGPAHLAPFGLPQLIYQPNIYNNEGNSWYSYNDAGYGILYSVGLSSYSDYIDKEFIIGEDAFVENNGTEITIKGIENYLNLDNPIFSDGSLYPSNSIYPIKTNYKYIILKYKVWQNVHSGDFDNVITTTTDTGCFYYMAIPINKFGKNDLTIKYERG